MLNETEAAIVECLGKASPNKTLEADEIASYVKERTGKGFLGIAKAMRELIERKGRVACEGDKKFTLLSAANQSCDGCDYVFTDDVDPYLYQIRTKTLELCHECFDEVKGREKEGGTK